MIAIDTMTDKVIASIPIGQAPQAVVYVPNAVPAITAADNGAMGLRPLDVAGRAAHLTMVPLGTTGPSGAKAPTSVTLFDQGLVQVLEASVTGLEPLHPYVLALASQADGSGTLEPLASFMANPAGAAIVNAIGPIRQVIQDGIDSFRLYLVIVPGSPEQLGKPIQIQAP